MFTFKKNTLKISNKIVSYFTDQPPEMPRKNIVLVSKCIFDFLKIIVWFTLMQKCIFFSQFCILFNKILWKWEQKPYDKELKKNLSHVYFQKVNILKFNWRQKMDK